MNTASKMIMVFLTIFITLSSCSKDDMDINNKNDTSTNAEYYVKYVVKCSQSRYYINSFSIATYKKTESFTDIKSKSWTQTYGPVKKGFYATATASSVYPTIEIYVSKNGGPFALKASKTSNDKVTVSYTINF